MIASIFLAFAVEKFLDFLDFLLRWWQDVRSLEGLPGLPLGLLNVVEGRYDLFTDFLAGLDDLDASGNFHPRLLRELLPPVGVEFVQRLAIALFVWRSS